MHQNEFVPSKNKAALPLCVLSPVLLRSRLFIAARPSPIDLSLSTAVRFSRQLRKAEAIEKTSERDIEDYSHQRDQIEVRTDGLPAPRKVFNALPAPNKNTINVLSAS